MQTKLILITDLKPGDEFKDPSSGLFYKVSSIHPYPKDDLTLVACQNCRIKAYPNKPVTMVEVPIETMPNVFVLNIKDSKEAPNYALKKAFQGRYFHPQKWYMYWYVWGSYCFDMREVRKHLGETVEFVQQGRSEAEMFKFSITGLIKLIGNRCFFDVLIEVAHKMNARYEAESEAYRVRMATQDADLPF